MHSRHQFALIGVVLEHVVGACFAAIGKHIRCGADVDRGHGDALRLTVGLGCAYGFQPLRSRNTDQRDTRPAPFDAGEYSGFGRFGRASIARSLQRGHTVIAGPCSQDQNIGGITHDFPLLKATVAPIVHATMPAVH